MRRVGLILGAIVAVLALREIGGRAGVCTLVAAGDAIEETTLD